MVDLSRAAWRKSSMCQEGSCVEVAFADEAVAVRRSGEEHGPALILTLAEWSAFVAGVRNGEFDLG